MHGAEFLKRAEQHADGIVKVDGVDRKPLAQILAHRQPHRLPDVPAAKGRLNVPFEGQALRMEAPSADESTHMKTFSWRCRPLLCDRVEHAVA